MWMRRIARLAAFALLLLAVPFVGIEAGLRIYALLPADSALFVEDPETGLIRMRSGIALDEKRTNSRGFNDVERSPIRPPGVSRLAVIGDSFVFGRVARKDNVPAQIQRLADTAGARLEVLNMGVPATGPSNYLALVEHEAAAFEVDVACVFLFVGNDVAATHPDFVQRIWLGMPRPALRHPLVVGGSATHWYVYRLVRNLARQLRERVGQRPDGATFTSENFIALEAQRMPLFEIERSATMRESIDETIAVLERADLAARERGIGLLVVLAPAEVQVHPDLMAEMRRVHGLDPADYDLVEPQRQLASRLADRGVPVLDLLPAFLESAERERLFLLQDTHWNAAGNALAASETWRSLVEHGLVALP